MRNETCRAEGMARLIPRLCFSPRLGVLAYFSFVAALVFGIPIYLYALQRHRRELEVSLVRHLLLDYQDHVMHASQEEQLFLDEIQDWPGFESDVYLSEPGLFIGIGRPNSAGLRAPSLDFLEEVGVSGIEPMTSKADGFPFFYVHFKDWIDWNTVVIDFGLVNAPESGLGMDGATCTFEDGSWKIIHGNRMWEA